MDTNEKIDSKSFDKGFMKIIMIWTNYKVSPIFYYVQNDKRLPQLICRSNKLAQPKVCLYALMM